MTPTHPDLDPDQIEQARRELGFSKRVRPGEPKQPKAPWRVRLQRRIRRVLRPVYSRLGDAVAERVFVDNPIGRDVSRLEAAVTRVEAELELLRGQLAAQRELLDRLDARPGEPPSAP